MNNIILRGIKKIPKVLIRKCVNQVKLKDGNYEQKILGYWIRLEVI